MISYTFLIRSILQFVILTGDWIFVAKLIFLKTVKLIYTTITKSSDVTYGLFVSDVCFNFDLLMQLYDLLLITPFVKNLNKYFFLLVLFCSSRSGEKIEPGIVACSTSMGKS
jgi:hypothetical protein